MSSSKISVLLKSPSKLRNSLHNLCGEYSQILFYISWLISVVQSACICSLNTHHMSVLLTFPLPDLCFMALSTILLNKGIFEKKMVLMIPWVILTSASLYLNHAKELIHIHATFKTTRRMGVLPWCVFVMSFIILVVRLVLIMKVVHCGAVIYLNRCVFNEKKHLSTDRFKEKVK